MLVYTTNKVYCAWEGTLHGINNTTKYTVHITAYYLNRVNKYRVVKDKCTRAYRFAEG